MDYSPSIVFDHRSLVQKAANAANIEIRPVSIVVSQQLPFLWKQHEILDGYLIKSLKKTCRDVEKQHQNRQKQIETAQKLLKQHSV